MLPFLHSSFPARRGRSRDGGGWRPGLLVALLAGSLAVTGCSTEPAARDEEEVGTLPDTVTVYEEVQPDEVVFEEPPVSLPSDTLNDDRSVAERLRDASTAARVRMRLVEESSLRPYELRPEVEQGQVTLLGAVRTDAERRLAAEVVRQVQGVRTVINHLEATEEPLVAGIDAEQDVEAGEEQEEAPAVEAEPEVEAEAASAETHHTVQRGESLWVISRRYGVSIAHIRQLNGLRSDAVRPGQRLRVR